MRGKKKTFEGGYINLHIRYFKILLTHVALKVNFISLLILLHHPLDPILQTEKSTVI